MDELATRAPFGNRIEAAFHEVLDRLHIMIGLAFVLLDFGSFGFGQIGCQRVQHAERCGGQAAQFDDAWIAQPAP